MGLSSTELGIGLAIIRMASLASLPIVGLADRFGRRSLLLTTLSLGLALTVIAALSPGYWWFVVIFALGRPLLSSTNVLTEVIAAEQTDARDRAAAIALVAAGYGVGAGLTAVIHSLASSALGFRGLFGLALVPLALVPFLGRWIEEPDRFGSPRRAERPRPVLGPVGPRFRTPRGHRADRVRHLRHHRSGQQLRFRVCPERAAPTGYVTAAMVLGAGLAGLAGLLVAGGGRPPRPATHGRARDDQSGAVRHARLSGFESALFVGYILGVMAGSVFAPAIGACWPSYSPRRSGHQWPGGGWRPGYRRRAVSWSSAPSPTSAAGSVSLPYSPSPRRPVAGLFWMVPETRGAEPEDLWPVAPSAPSG